MKTFFAVLLVVHGLIHLIGTAKAFDVADIPQLTQPIARPLGLLWLLAAALFLVAAMLLFTWPQRWWVAGTGAVIVSQIVILTSWSDARYGTIANIVALVGVALGFLSQGPSSFRAESRSRDCAGPESSRHNAASHRGRSRAAPDARAAVYPAQRRRGTATGPELPCPLSRADPQRAERTMDVLHR